MFKNFEIWNQRKMLSRTIIQDLLEEIEGGMKNSFLLFLFIG